MKNWKDIRGLRFINHWNPSDLVEQNDLCTVIDWYRIFMEDRQGRRGREFTLSVKEFLGCAELQYRIGEGSVKYLQPDLREKYN